MRPFKRMVNIKAHCNRISDSIYERIPFSCPDLTKLYRFPYTPTENPNTIIEPTRRCNLQCPGCYRRTHLANKEERDMSLDEMRQYIDDVARLRNTSCLSFLRGGALLHPQVNDAIAYAKKRGFNVGLYTNGLVHDDQRLKELRDLEVSYVKIHVDKHQGRGDTEEKINQLREHFCDDCTDASLYEGKFIPMCSLDYAITHKGPLDWMIN